MTSLRRRAQDDILAASCRLDRHPHLPQERLVPDDLVLHVRLQLPVGVDGGQFHGRALDRRLSPAEASPAVHAASRHRRGFLHGRGDIFGGKG